MDAWRRNVPVVREIDEWDLFNRWQEDGMGSSMQLPGQGSSTFGSKRPPHSAKSHWEMCWPLASANTFSVAFAE
jgi:hypothetical protein